MNPKWRFARIERLPQYVFNILAELKVQAQAQGEDIIDLGMGNPDLGTPTPIVESLKKAADDPEHHRYYPGKGSPQLRQAVCAFYKRQYNVDLNPETEIIATLGAKEGLSHFMLATINEGDSVVVPNPYYPIHFYSVVLAGGNPLGIPVFPGANFEEKFFHDLKEIWQKEKNPPKAIMMCFPHNPTTTSVGPSFFQKIVDFAHKHNILLVHDLAYGDIVFDGYRAPSILQTPGAKDVAVEVYSMSKGFNMPGWRIGFFSGNATMVAALERMKSYLDYGIFRPIQIAATYALNSSYDCVTQNVATYRQRRDVLTKALNEMGWKVATPNATMFIWAKIPARFQSMDSLDFAKKLLTEAGVVVSPGICFGDNGEGHVRFSLVDTRERIKEGVSRIQRCLNL